MTDSTITPELLRQAVKILEEAHAKERDRRLLVMPSEVQFMLSQGYRPGEFIVVRPIPLTPRDNIFDAALKELAGK